MELLYEFYNTMIDFLWSCVLSLMVLLKDLAFFLLEELMNAVSVLLDSFVYVFETIDLTQYITSLPDSVTDVMGLCGIGTCTSMIVIALLVRFLMQLIPFVRLGS